MGRQVQGCVLDALEPEVAVVVRHAHTQPTAGLQQADTPLQKTPGVRDMFEHLEHTHDIELADAALDRVDQITQRRRAAQPLRDSDSLGTQVDARRAGLPPITQDVQERPDPAAYVQHVRVLRDILQGHPVFPLLLSVVPGKRLELSVQVLGPDRVRKVVRQLARLTGVFREAPNVRDLVRDVEPEVGAPPFDKGVRVEHAPLMGATVAERAGHAFGERIVNRRVCLPVLKRRGHMGHAVTVQCLRTSCREPEELGFRSSMLSEDRRVLTLGAKSQPIAESPPSNLRSARKPSLAMQNRH